MPGTPYDQLVTIIDVNGNPVTVSAGALSVSPVADLSTKPDGAKGPNTGSAIEYLWNGGGPRDANGVATALAFDRLRSINAKGVMAFAITPATTGDTSIVFTGGAASTKTLAPGQAVQLFGGAPSAETVYVRPDFVSGSSATVPLQSPVVQTGQSNAQWDAYSTNGPGINGFLGFGIGVETLSFYDPTNAQFFALRAATEDTRGPSTFPEMVSGVFNGATIDRVRTPATFKSVTSAAAGNTALWTPATGKKFRLMRFILQVTDNAAQAAGGILTVKFQDAAADIGISFPVFVPGAAGTLTGDTNVSGGWLDLGNGYLSTAANNVLNLNLSSALTAGVVSAFVVGTEE